MSTQATTQSTQAATEVINVSKKPRKPQRKWTVEEEIDLIDRVRSYPFLWDKRDLMYRNRDKRAESQKEIHASMSLLDVTVEDLWTKWENMRTQFSKYLKPKPSGSGGRKTVWVHFERMQFIKDFVEPRSSTGNMAEDEKDERPCTQLLEGPADDVQEIQTLSSGSSDITPTRKRKRTGETTMDKDQLMDTIKNLFGEKEQELDEEIRRASEPDKFDLLGQEIAGRLRSLPEEGMAENAMISLRRVLIEMEHNYYFVG